VKQNNNNATMFDGQMENRVGGIVSTNNSFFGPSTSSQNHLFNQSPASSSSAIIDQQQNRQFMSLIGRKKKLPSNATFIGRESNNNLNNQQKDRFKYFGGTSNLFEIK
jgi:hypothetical protein